MVRWLTRLVFTPVVVLLALPGAAYGAEVIGSDLGGTGLGTSCSFASGCVLVQETIDGEFVDPSGDGVITSWRTNGADGPMALRTYRQSQGETFVAGELHATPVDQSETQNGNTGTQTFLTQIPVKAEDYIALVLADGSDWAFRQSPPPNTNRFLFEDTNSAGDVDVAAGSAQEVWYQARVEPDADRDGLGDETQDPCVGCGGAALPTQQAATPGPAPDPFAAIRARGPSVSLAARARASRNGTVPIVLTNPYAFRLTGRLSLRDGRRRAGSKGFSLGPNARKTVKVKLPRKVFRKLKRRRSLRLTALAKAKAPVGRSRTSRRKVRVSAPARKRKRRRKPKPPVDLPLDGTYTGKTDQGRSITIRSINNRRQIRVFVTTALTSLCLSNGSQDSPENVNILPPVPFPVAANGSFSLDARNEAEDYDPNYRIQGTLTAARVSGFFAWRRTRIIIGGTQSCATREIKFEATRQ